ncbi:hypothetical protein FHL15_006909 [Xylaria flabelliformis]|uniref:Uncharacterized protein n=1 Tax=Xylaria flabelliformis TaxID=2512241 RepID=A0A553HWG2_9PEZI|nr:hypothetical protein FHL15_006909 [Xylaria flabelliformis]
MASTDGIPPTYHSLMAHHKYGYALYHPECSLVVKPGVCGYIDGEGGWHIMVDILAIDSTPASSTSENTESQDSNLTGSNKRQYTSLDETNILKREKKSLCGPILAETVELASSAIGAGTTLPPGIPAEASAVAEFTLNADLGAVLLTKGLVTKNSLNGLDPFREWAKANFGKLLAEFPVIRTYGFYIVTSTLKAKEVFIKSWQNKGHQLNVGFSGSVESIAQISASTQIYGASRADGWIMPICEGSSFPRNLFSRFS